MAATIFSPDEALLRLALITRAIADLRSEDEPGLQAALELVAGSAAGFLPGAAISICLFDPIRSALNTAGCINAGQDFPKGAADPFLPGGLAEEALRSKSIRTSWEAARPTPASLPLACFPLNAAGEALGVLAAIQPEGHQLGPGELAWLEHLTGLAGLAVTMARRTAPAQTEQSRRESQLRRLRRAGMLISSRSSLQDTLDAILKMALEITDASYGIFRLVDSSGEYLVTRSFTGQGLAQPAIENLPMSASSVMGYVAKTREPVVIPDLRQEPWKGIYYPLDHGLEMRSEVAVPLIGASGRLEGVLNLESPELTAFDKEDRYILQILATQAVVAIQEVRLLDALREIAAMLYTLPLASVHQALVERACDLLNVPTSLIWLLEKGRLVVQAASQPEACNQSLPLDDWPTGRAILLEEPVILIEVKPYEAELPILVGAGSALIVPFSAGGEPRLCGAFSVYTASGDRRGFGQSDWNERVLSILGHYAGLAVQNAAHLEALRLAEDQRATTETFAAIGDIAANLLHRLNNKVGTIPVRVEGIQDKCEALLQGDPYLASNLAEIQRSAAEAMQVVRESLDHLRPIELAPVSVAACVREALTSTRLPSGVKVTTYGLNALPAVQAGADRLSLVFANLLENASDAMNGQGAIKVRGSVQGPWVEVRVSDTGPGIPAGLYERIFDFSYSSGASHPGKLGFGLWWVKSLVTRFGGRVAVESSGRNGTTFVVSLPLAGRAS